MPTNVPIFRIFDCKKAVEFYVDWLGLKIDWEHKFDEESPLYIQVLRDGIVLHLSEHHGDSTPGFKAFVTIDDARAYYREVSFRNYKFNRPGLEMAPWDAPCFEVIDPFVNKLLITEVGRKRKLIWFLIQRLLARSAATTRTNLCPPMPASIFTSAKIATPF